MLSTKEIIRKGYFPKEVVPALTTEGLSSILPKIESVVKAKDGVSSYCSYDLPRLKNFRRVLSIPNPRNQVRLSIEIKENWREIKNHLNKSDLSISTPTIRASSDRYFSPKHDLGKIPKERVMNSTSSRYLLYTDISRYYSTIYTHSIPWALHTKPTAKKDKSDALLGNRLDKFVRNAQHAQTLGIPTGPDTSLAISELIGSTIDMELKEQIGSKRQISRCMETSLKLWDNPLN